MIIQGFYISTIPGEEKRQVWTIIGEFEFSDNAQLQNFKNAIAENWKILDFEVEVYEETGFSELPF